MSRQDTAGTHRGATQSTAGTWFQGKRLPLYGVVGATFAFAGYSFFFNTAKHPEASSTVSDKKSGLPSEGQEEQAKDYSENKPSKKVLEAAGTKEGEKGSGIFPNSQVGKKLASDDK